MQDQPAPWSKRRTIQSLGRNLSLEIAAVLWTAEVSAILHHHLAAHDRHHRPGKDVVAFPGRVIGLVQVGGANLAASGGIKYRDGVACVPTSRTRACCGLHPLRPGGS